MRRPSLLPLSLSLVFFTACSDAAAPPEVVAVTLTAMERFPPPILDGDGTFDVPGTKPDRPRLRYRDGQVSRNESCAIRLPNKLNPAIPPMYVNGSPIGFC